MGLKERRSALYFVRRVKKMSNFFIDLGTGVIQWYLIVIAAAGAYFLGNVNPAIIIGRAKGVDIRTQGSGNAGATNALRSLGKKAGVLTFVIDVAKGWAGYYIPLLVFLSISLRDEAIMSGMVSSQSAAADAAYIAWNTAALPPAMLCGLCVVLGHMYPAVFGFRGGKGVSTAFGVLLAASPLFALVLLAVVVVFTAIFRRVSLSVMIAVAVALVLVFWGGYFLQENLIYYVGFIRFSVFDPLWIIIILALVVWKHRSNIGRLVKGQEPKLSFGSGKKDKKGNGE